MGFHIVVDPAQFRISHRDPKSFEATLNAGNCVKIKTNLVIWETEKGASRGQENARWHFEKNAKAPEDICYEWRVEFER